MDNNNIEFEVKRYLMKMISDRYQVLRGHIYKAFGSDNYSTAYNSIADGFLGGANSDERKQIKLHKSIYAKKGFADYNYFDFDTLVAYLEYLTRLINTIENYAWQGNRSRVDSKVFNCALQDTLTYFNRCKNTPETAWYKGYAVLARKAETGELNPTKTNNSKVDMSRSWQYQEFIKQYMINKHEDREYFHDDASNQTEIYDARQSQKQARRRPVKREVSDVEISNDGDREEIIHKYKAGIKVRLYVDKKEYFYDENGRPLTRIWASSEYGALFTTLDADGFIYYGKLYDADGNSVMDSDGAGERFYPSILLKQQTAQTKQKDGLDNYTIDFD